MTTGGPGRRRPGGGQPARGAGEPKRVGASLRDVASIIGADGAVELAALGRQWASLVGEEVAAHSWPVSLRDGALTLGTDHHAWASQLRLLSGDILARLRPAGFAIVSVAVQVGQSEGRGW